MDSDYNSGLIKRDTLILDVLNGEYLGIHIANSKIPQPWLLSRQGALYYINTYTNCPEQYELIEMSEADYLWRWPPCWIRKQQKN